ncbi:ATPase F0F1 [Kineobactrum sediminis]|uniref:ATPase F0F1 n=1 Tax=Kineobactrum sediminis TaxID=1905677 RepID=A0A2N5Y215_9GAMM|nr:AtpZ/AtpI family protein [Kineobactrum sediminis]PLW82427.1 ATPase F0F1 [Kineobactrum sediminis]
MVEPKRPQDSGKKKQELSNKIGKRAAQKLRGRTRRKNAAWFGLGMFGLVGWSVAIPTLMGIALGLWLDRRWPGEVSWTLTFLIIGVALGCLNAWYWIRQESRRE